MSESTAFRRDLHHLAGHDPRFLQSGHEQIHQPTGCRSIGAGTGTVKNLHNEMLTRRTTGREANANGNKAPILIERVVHLVF